MLDLWEQNGPPVYIAVASYLGLTKDKTKKKTGTTSKVSGNDNRANLESLANSLGSTGGFI